MGSDDLLGFMGVLFMLLVVVGAKVVSVIYIARMNEELRVLEETRQISLNELKKIENENAVFNANLNLLTKQRSTLTRRIAALKKEVEKNEEESKHRGQRYKHKIER